MAATSTHASPHFTWAELTRTQTGLPNNPGASERQALQRTANDLLEKIRAIVSSYRGKDTPVHVSSGFRSLAVNAKVGGAEGSRHTYGEAADIHVTGMSSKDLITLLYQHRHQLPLDKCIWYATTGHVHVQIRPAGPRRRFLYKPAVGGYEEWSPDSNAGMAATVTQAVGDGVKAVGGPVVNTLPVVASTGMKLAVGVGVMGLVVATLFLAMSRGRSRS